MPTRFPLIGSRTLEQDQLPPGNAKKPAQLCQIRRRFFFLFVLPAVSLLLCLAAYIHLSAPSDKQALSSEPTSSSPQDVLPPKDALPPTYDRFHELERNYPQHNRSLPYPEGENGRFLWISNQHWGLGFNNVFQALILNAHMAYMSNRAYVFENYTWRLGPEQFVDYNGHLIPSRIPLATLIEGPVAGGPFPPEHPAPRAVSRDWFLSICPQHRRTRLAIEGMNAYVQNSDSVLQIMDKYVQKLNSMPDRCVELTGKDEHPFDFFHFGHSSLESLWPSLSISPILTHLRWSSLVNTALHANAAQIAPSLEMDPLPGLVPELMAIHVRRGDYSSHCKALAGWDSPYMGWNQMTGLPDRFVPPLNSGSNSTNMDLFMQHCLPTMERIVERIQQVDKEWTATGRQPITQLYVMTNGARPWVQELKQRLLETGRWTHVHTSREITYTHEQQYIKQTIDMAIAERAAVLLGNGFSSLTANVVLLRRIRGHPLESNRFW